MLLNYAYLHVNVKVMKKDFWDKLKKCGTWIIVYQVRTILLFQIKQTNRTLWPTILKI